MNADRLPELDRIARKVVKDAQKPGGLLEKAEFTMGVARRQIAERMQLGNGELDDGKWKKLVKEAVMKYLEGDEDEPEAGPSRSPSPPVKKKAAPTTKNKKSRSPSKVVEDEKQESASPPPKVAHAAEDDAGAESDMSSVYDVAPPKRRKKSSSAGGKKDADEDAGAKKRKKKDPDEELSPDESKVAELKRIVVACGVRKQWSKEFADCPTSTAQIRHLQSLLTGLGMKGTPTMGKAKSLKEKRELAAELDDVREFEAARGAATEDRRASRSQAVKRTSRSAEVDAGGDGTSEEDEAAGAGTGQKSALDSVMDFLGDQSD